jgi:hypothetical protein
MAQNHPSLTLEQSKKAVSALLAKARQEKTEADAHVDQLRAEGHRSGPEVWAAMCHAGKCSACISATENHLKTLNNMKENPLT